MSNASLQIMSYQADDRPQIRRILTSIGWEEHYIAVFEQAAGRFAGQVNSAVYLARLDGIPAGFVFVEFYPWNRLAQIQGLATDGALQRRGVASALVEQAENFARSHQARGIYVDTPSGNGRGRSFYEAVGYRLGYLMPRYYADAMDGVTYQKFFEQQDE